MGPLKLCQCKTSRAIADRVVYCALSIPTNRPLLSTEITAHSRQLGYNVRSSIKLVYLPRYKILSFNLAISREMKFPSKNKTYTWKDFYTTAQKFYCTSKLSFHVCLTGRRDNIGAYD